MLSTSRVGRKPIAIPSGVEVKISDASVAIKGPKGQLVLPLHPGVALQLDGTSLKFSSHEAGKQHIRKGSGSKTHKAIVGTFRSKIANVVTGVTKGFERKLLLVGVGYKAQAKGKSITINIGFSHPVEYHAPEGITLETPSPTEIIVKGIDKHLVGHVAATIRAVRGPEPYKLKGIRYEGERLIRKETKKK